MLFLNLPGLQAQLPARTDLKFDAASIKLYRSTSAEGRMGGNGGLIFMPESVASTPGGVTAKRIILEAYNLTDYELSGGPRWLDSDRFDLRAKSEAPADKNQLRLMLQTLLGERFRLRIRQEMKDMPVYVLTTGNKKPSLYPIKEGDNDPPLAPLGSRNATYHAISRGTMQEFAHSISTDMGRPVLDKTGITGIYFFFLQWDEDGGFGAAVQEQLGLKFESRKAPIKILIVDDIETPSVN
jgi:uncharacterized protein (TIGR03435 family)